MLKHKQTASEIWSEYQKGVSYNSSIDLYETIKKNENFYIGKQWQGLNAPDLAKPVINVLRRVVSYFISMIVSDDVAASFTAFSPAHEREARAMSIQVEQVIEQADLKVLARDALRDSAVDGDGAIYFYYDTESVNHDGSRGKIVGEVISASSVHYGNPYSSDIQKQPYIIISMRKTLKSVREEAKLAGIDSENIVPEDDANQYDVRGYTGDELVTVLLKLWREDSRIWAQRSTKEVVLREAWDTGLHRYPIAVMSWDKIKNSCRGVSAIGAMIPNQIAINQLFAMAIHHVKTMAFPKIIYDASKIDAWSNKVGQAIGTTGNPNDAIATGFRAPDMSSQVLLLIQNLTQSTLEFMGASDAALGNVVPTNTSAIIATQKASAMPLEIQRLAFYRFTEDYVRIIVDMIATHYGPRLVNFEGEGLQIFDFSTVNDADLSLKVDVGASTYWSELMQMQTLDNLFTKGIVTDAITYLESVPSRYIHGKEKLIEKLREQAKLPQE